jgi:hypothetical protein
VFLFLSAVKLVCEIALMALAGQGLLYLLAGPKRDTNLFYQLLKILTRPFTTAARWITPKQVGDHQVGYVAFFLLAIVWAVVTFERIQWCLQAGMELCR